jgi:uncharacterized protein YndB with AHSA1/START domain
LREIATKTGQTMPDEPNFDLTLTRDFAAPRKSVFRCWSEPVHLMQWFVPKPNRVIACTLDLRAGGACNTTFDVGGQIIENRGVYLEVIPDEKIVFTDTYTEGWRPNPEPFITAIITLSDTPSGGTRYTAVVRHRSQEAADHHKNMGFFEGWGIAADQLEAHALTL